MSAFEYQAFGAIAFQLTASLDTYEADVAALVRNPRDLEPYQRVSGHMDRMRKYAASLPPLAAAWVELMIRHFELTHGLWRLQRDQASEAELAQLHVQLRHAMQRLSLKCGQLMPSA